MKEVKVFPEHAIFPKGEKIANDHFIGNVWLQMLVPADDLFRCPIGYVTFEPGARNNLHRHPGGQILLVTGGKGYCQDEGGPVRVLRGGDVITVRPGVKHWHGAAPDSWFTHIAISTNAQRGDAEWLEPLTDEEYAAIGQGLRNEPGGT